MARTIEQINAANLAAISANAVLAGFTSTSAVAIFRALAYVISVGQCVLENLFDFHKAEVQNIIATTKPHTRLWYVTKAKAFQYGYDLVPDTDTYDNTGIDAATIAASQIVAYAAAVEINNQLRIKVAKLTGGALGPLTNGELAAFSAYIAEIKDAGVKNLNITSGSPDYLKLNLNIFYNPLVLDGSGQRLDGTDNTPVQDAIVTFLQNLPFNGLFVLDRLTTALVAVEGVVICSCTSAQEKYGLLPYTNIAVEYTPDAGYMVLDPIDGLTLTFTPHAPI